MLLCQVLHVAELQSLVGKRVAWHEANISEFVEMESNYVDPGHPAAAESAASGGARAGGGPPVADNTLPLASGWHPLASPGID